MSTDVQTYNESQIGDSKAICDVLLRIISSELPEAENKVWHAHPVWFLDGNPIVGYDKLKDCVRLLFWSGQSFDEPGLKAEARYTSEDQIDVASLKRWLGKSKTIQWDYKNIVKRQGQLERI